MLTESNWDVVGASSELQKENGMADDVDVSKEKSIQAMTGNESYDHLLHLPLIVRQSHIAVASSSNSIKTPLVRGNGWSEVLTVSRVALREEGEGGSKHDHHLPAIDGKNRQAKGISTKSLQKTRKVVPLGSTKCWPEAISASASAAAEEENPVDMLLPPIVRLSHHAAAMVTTERTSTLTPLVTSSRKKPPVGEIVATVAEEEAETITVRQSHPAITATTAQKIPNAVTTRKSWPGAVSAAEVAAIVNEEEEEEDSDDSHLPLIVRQSRRTAGITTLKVTEGRWPATTLTSTTEEEEDNFNLPLIVRKSLQAAGIVTTKGALINPPVGRKSCPPVGAEVAKEEKQTNGLSITATKLTETPEAGKVCQPTVTSLPKEIWDDDDAHLPLIVRNSRRAVGIEELSTAFPPQSHGCSAKAVEAVVGQEKTSKLPFVAGQIREATRNNFGVSVVEMSQNKNWENEAGIDAVVKEGILQENAVVFNKSLEVFTEAAGSALEWRRTCSCKEKKRIFLDDHIWDGHDDEDDEEEKDENYTDIGWKKPSWTKLISKLKPTDQGKKLKESGNIANPITFPIQKKAINFGVDGDDEEEERQNGNNDNNNKKKKLCLHPGAIKMVDLPERNGSQKHLKFTVNGNKIRDGKEISDGITKPRKGKKHFDRIEEANQDLLKLTPRGFNVRLGKGLEGPITDATTTAKKKKKSQKEYHIANPASLTPTDRGKRMKEGSTLARPITCQYY